MYTFSLPQKSAQRTCALRGRLALINDYLTFCKMITPMIVQTIFWLGVGICVIAGLISIVGGAGSYTGGGMQVLVGVILLVVGPVVIRIYCELLILFFRMNETLTDIRASLQARGPAAPSVRGE